MSFNNKSNFYGVKSIQESFNSSTNNLTNDVRRFQEDREATYMEETSVSCDCESGNNYPTSSCQTNQPCSSGGSSTCQSCANKQANSQACGCKTSSCQPSPCPPSPCPPSPCPPSPCPPSPCPPSPCPPSPCPPSPCPPSPCPPSPCPPSPCPPTNTCDECGPVNNCCNGTSCTFNPCNAKCVCTYMNVLYDEEVASGSTVFNILNATVPNYLITSEFNPSSSNSCGSCGNGCGCYCNCNCGGSTCSIDSTSTFTIDSVNTTIKSFVLPSSIASSISTSSILIGGLSPLAVTQTSSGYSAIVDPSVLNDVCNCNNSGTKSNVIIQGLAGWNYFAKYVICGKVTTKGSTCQFKLIVQNNTIPDVITQALIFASPNVCLPNTQDTSNPIVLDIQFGANGQLVNPVITAVGGPSPLPVTLTVSGNLMLSTKANLYVTKKSKVCLEGNVY